MNFLGVVFSATNESLFIYHRDYGQKWISINEENLEEHLKEHYLNFNYYGKDIQLLWKPHKNCMRLREQRWSTLIKNSALYLIGSQHIRREGYQLYDYISSSYTCVNKYIQLYHAKRKLSRSNYNEVESIDTLFSRHWKSENDLSPTLWHRMELNHRH